MNYLQTIKDSVRIFRASKLIWIFGFLTLLSTIYGYILQFIRTNLALTFLFSLAAIGLLYISMITYPGLIYVIQQVSKNEKVTFSEVWLQGKSKAARFFGFILLVIPLVLIIAFLSAIITRLAPKSPLLWLSAILQSILPVSFVIFSLCAIVIDDICGWNAAKTSILILWNNFFRVCVLLGAIFLIRVLFTELIAVILASGLFKTGLPISFALDYPKYVKLMGIPVISWLNWIFNLFLTPLQTILLVLGYVKFTKDVSYPALEENRSQPEASPTLPPPA